MTLQGHQPDVSVDVDISDPDLAAALAPLVGAGVVPGIPSYLLTDRLPGQLPPGRKVLLLFGAETPVGLNPMHVYVRFPPSALCIVVSYLF